MRRNLSVSTSSSSKSLVVVIFLSFCLLLLLSIMADAVDGGGGGEAAVHIVYTEKPENEEPEAFHIRTLTNVLGSEEAAKEAILYSYKTAASGFSAKLTPAQVSQISKEPGVLQVVPSRTYQLHSGPSRVN